MKSAVVKPTKPAEPAKPVKDDALEFPMKPMKVGATSSKDDA